MTPRIPFSAKICIVGAGPAGLSHAHYLRKAGYSNIQLLEINPDVGGKCHTLTFNNRSFDMGANYLTPDYTHVMEMAREVGAKMYRERSPIAFDPETKKLSKLMNRVLDGTNLFAFIISALRYFFIRWRLNKVLPYAGNTGLADKPELMVTMQEWLDNHGLKNLTNLFSIPVTMMGYGRLDEVPAPYVLRYIGVGTFRTMLLFGAGLPSFYPKRFVDGFQRFWLRISWPLDVRTNVKITQVVRSDGKVHVKYDQFRMHDTGKQTESYEATFDHLVLSCPLTVKTLKPFLDLSAEETEMFSPDKVKHRNFGITLIDDDRPSTGDYRVFHIFPLAKKGTPSIFAHQFPSNPAYEIYTPMTEEEMAKDPDEIRAELEGMSKQLIGDMDGKATEMLHYDVWDYFFHVELKDFKAGYYDRLEAMQGKNNTFYNMGLNSFELIEPITRYSKHLVSRYYLGVEA